MISDRPATIAAIATPPGQGGIGIVRVSGPHAREIAAAVAPPIPSPRVASYRAFVSHGGEHLDHGVVVYFPGPGSYTGEDTLELQGHGGPVVLDRVLARVLEVGAQAARPGEFTERAFLNGRMDLARAEAVASLIEAESESAARAAMRSLEGEFSRRINALVEELISLRVFVEASIDFAEEEIDFLAESDVAYRVNGVSAHIQEVIKAAHHGTLLTEGARVALVGAPNVGKSTLLNALAGHEAAIVTDIPGTTRDVVRERIVLDGVPIRLSDTAGLRESVDVVEQIGVGRARAAALEADLALHVVDDRVGSGPADAALLTGVAAECTLEVRNKIDLSGSEAGACTTAGTRESIRISAMTGDGMDELRAAIPKSLGLAENIPAVFSARRRHLEALEQACASLERGQLRLSEGAGELLAEDLSQAQKSLGEITGVFTSEDLLGRIFSSFCIGK